MITQKINISDDILVKQLKQGDYFAMEILAIKYQKRIYNTILNISLNHHDAEDLTQQTFLKALENISAFQQKSSFYTWIFKIAVNLTLNHCRAKSSSAAFSIDVENINHPAQSANSLKHFIVDNNIADPALIAENTELIKLIKLALSKLNNSHRALIILRDFEGADYAQIARILSLKSGTVKSRLSRARASLAQTFNRICSSNSSLQSPRLSARA